MAGNRVKFIFFTANISRQEFCIVFRNIFSRCKACSEAGHQYFKTPFSQIRYAQKQGKTDSTIAGGFRLPTEKAPMTPGTLRDAIEWTLYLETQNNV